MESLQNITAQDIQNGALERMLNQAGIVNVQQYVKQFHHETEEIIIEDLQQHENSGQDTDANEVIPAADVSSWLARSRPLLEHSMETMTIEQKPQPIEEKKGPTDLSGFMQKLGPNPNPSFTTNADESDTHVRVTGDLNTWLTDWSKNLTRQTPTSLDTWLQSLTPSSFDESLGQKTDAKTRVNAYLNAAQKVLSKHGYKVSNTNQPTKVEPKKTGLLNNVKDMYFLVNLIERMKCVNLS